MREFASAAVLIALLGGAASSSADEMPLRVGVAPGSPPFVLSDGGNLQGFTIDLFKAIGVRMKRRVDFVQAAMPTLLAGLRDGKLDVLGGPIQATPERSAEMLFTEGYIWSQYQFGTRHGTHLDKLGDLRGKRLAVQSGTEYAEWAELNAGKYGFAVEKLPTLAVVLAAVRSGTADVCLSDSPGLEAAAHDHDALDAGFALPETRVQDAAAVARPDVELRDDVEDALTCLKQDGTVARLSQQWFGDEADQEDLQRLVVPGYGVPGLTGYDPKPRKPRCGP